MRAFPIFFFNRKAVGTRLEGRGWEGGRACLEGIKK